MAGSAPPDPRRAGALAASQASCSSLKGGADIDSKIVG